MSRRTLLSPEQRARLFGTPTDPAEMAKHYVLSAEDQALVRSKRRSSNRLGFAVQLCLLRHPGQGLGPDEPPPEAMIAFVAHQLGCSPAAFGEYALRDQTRRDHAVELQKLLHLRSFRLADWRTCLQVGTNAAWATDRGEPIVAAMLAHLRAANVLVPTTTVLERIGLTARARARKRTFQVLADGLTDAAREAFDGLLILDPAVRRSRFAWLRDYAESPAPSNMIALLDRLDYVRSLGVDAERTRRIHPARLGRLLSEAAIMTVQHIADLEPTCRTAILVAQITELETRIADATLAMFEKYVGSLFSKAQNRDERRFQATKRDVAKALLLFRRTIAALKQAQETGEDGVAVVDREVGMRRLDEALPIIGAVAEVADQDSSSPQPSAIPSCADSVRASLPHSSSSRMCRTIRSWSRSRSSKHWIALAPATCPSVSRCRSYRRNGAS
jgi:Domain of unknown function (DUF4158)